MSDQTYAKAWDDLHDRLRRAGHSLDELANRDGSANATRLRGKAEGVRLALSYMTEARPTLGDAEHGGAD